MGAPEHAPTTLLLTRTVPRWDQTEITRHLARPAKACGIIQRRHIRGRRDRSDPRQRHESGDIRILRGDGGKSLVRPGELLGEDLDHRLQRTERLHDRRRVVNQLATNHPVADLDPAGPVLRVDDEDASRADDQVVDVRLLPSRPRQVVQHEPPGGLELRQHLPGGTFAEPLPPPSALPTAPAERSSPGAAARSRPPSSRPSSSWPAG